MRKTVHPEKIPSLVYATEKGEIHDLPDISMSARRGTDIVEPELSTLIPLPEGSELFVLAGRSPVGWDPAKKLPVHLAFDPLTKKAVSAVAAFVAPAYTSLYIAAYKKARGAPLLPLFAYTAVGWLDGRFWVTAFRSDADVRQDIRQFHLPAISRRTVKKLKQFRNNRLIQHLGKCCLTYGCPAARNYFLGRWEAPVPTSPHCNASCEGCISLQTSKCCPSAQERITFVPTAGEITEMAVPHLKRAPRPIVSFGQGCEGEPLLQAKVIEQAIREIRNQTSRGTININSNASLPGKVERLARAGLDSIRVSMNSAVAERYSRYYRPRGYSFDDVRASIRTMKKMNKFVSVNYFVLPGFTDSPREMSAFFDLVEDCKPDLIQLRNLNMDPDRYLRTVRHGTTSGAAGILHWLDTLKRNFPWLRFGYFNPCLGPG